LLVIQIRKAENIFIVSTSVTVALTTYLFAFVAVSMSAVALYSSMRLHHANAQLKQLRRYASKLKTSQLALKKHAFYDHLTGLANRSLLIDRFQIAVQHAKRSQQKFAVLMVDLNKFKLINDNYGHAAGDTVLITVAKRLVAAVRSSDTVARLGGDEFVLIIQSIEHPEQVVALGHKLMDLLSEEVRLESGEVVSLGGSVGFAWYPKDGDSLRDVLEVADQAMYFCKTSGLMPLS
jgi:diguanylate cyclase (GGDEF)-like protein